MDAEAEVMFGQPVVWVTMWTQKVIRLNHYERVYGAVVKRRMPLFPSASRRDTCPTGSGTPSAPSCSSQ